MSELNIKVSGTRIPGQLEITEGKKTWKKRGEKVR